MDDFSLKKVKMDVIVVVDGVLMVVGMVQALAALLLCERKRAHVGGFVQREIENVLFLNLRGHLRQFDVQSLVAIV